MGLDEVYQETKELLEEIENAKEEEVDNEDTDKPRDDDADTSAEDEQRDDAEEAGTDEQEDAVEEEAKEPEKEEEIAEASAYARMRRAEREAKAAKDKIAELEAGVVETPDAVEEDLNPAIAEMVEDHKISKAKQEYIAYEENFKGTVDDYDDVSNGYKAALYQSIKAQNPRSTHADLLDKTQMHMLRTAGTYYNQGLDPAQEMYEDAKSLGFKSQPKAEAKEEVIKPDLDKIKKNKAKNAGMVAGSGSGSDGLLTREAAVSELTVGDWAKLPAGEKRRLLNGG